jgi:hypothetical protein
MLEARITKTVVLWDEKAKGTCLMGVAEFYDDKVNFKVVYDWETLDKDGFIKDLREELARAFDMPLKTIDVREKEILKKMEIYHIWSKEQESKVIH